MYFIIVTLLGHVPRRSMMLLDTVLLSEYIFISAAATNAGC